MTDFSLDGAAAAEVSDQPGRQPAARATDQDAGPCFAMSAVAAIDDGEVGVARHLRQHEDLTPEVVVDEDAGRIGAGVGGSQADLRERGLVTGTEGTDVGHPTSL